MYKQHWLAGHRQLLPTRRTHRFELSLSIAFRRFSSLAIAFYRFPLLASHFRPANRNGRCYYWPRHVEQLAYGNTVHKLEIALGASSSIDRRAVIGWPAQQH